MRASGSSVRAALVSGKEIPGEPVSLILRLFRQDIRNELHAAEITFIPSQWVAAKQNDICNYVYMRGVK